MNDSAVRAKLLWSSLQILNRERYQALIEVFGTLEEACKHVDEQLLRSLGCRDQAVKSAMERLEKCDVDKELEALQSVKARIISLTDEGYPESLQNIPDAPVFLYARGDFSVLNRPCVSVVGTRGMSIYGERVTREFSRALVQAKVVTVSGLAYGVDACVAGETISAGGTTVAVLGQGLLSSSRLSSQELAARIVASGGLILSEFPLRYPADMFTFPLRNRIVAGLSLGTLVTEAPASSGALITAKLAFDYGREVFAIPGQIYDENYAGCHALIAQSRAKLVATPADVLRELGMIPPDPEQMVLYLPQNEREKALLKILSSLPQPVDELVGKSDLSAGVVISTLTVLELNGAVKNLGGGQWIRV